MAPAGGWVISNDDVAAFTTAHPDRFAGLAAVNLADPIAAVRELRRAVEELGFVGLRVVPWLWESPPDHRLYYPLYVACVELGIPFCTQVGTPVRCCRRRPGVRCRTSTELPSTSRSWSSSAGASAIHRPTK